MDGINGFHRICSELPGSVWRSIECSYLTLMEGGPKYLISMEFGVVVAYSNRALQSGEFSMVFSSGGVQNHWHVDFSGLYKLLYSHP